MALLVALTQAWTAAEAALRLGWQVFESMPYDRRP